MSCQENWGLNTCNFSVNTVFVLSAFCSVSALSLQTLICDWRPVSFLLTGESFWLNSSVLVVSSLRICWFIEAYKTAKLYKFVLLII